VKRVVKEKADGEGRRGETDRYQQSPHFIGSPRVPKLTAPVPALTTGTEGATRTTATNSNNDGQGLEEAGAPAQVRGDGATEEVPVSSDEEAQVLAKQDGNGDTERWRRDAEFAAEHADGVPADVAIGRERGEQ